MSLSRLIDPATLRVIGGRGSVLETPARCKLFCRRDSASNTEFQTRWDQLPRRAIVGRSKKIISHASVRHESRLRYARFIDREDQLSDRLTSRGTYTRERSRVRFLARVSRLPPSLPFPSRPSRSPLLCFSFLFDRRIHARAQAYRERKRDIRL